MLVDNEAKTSWPALILVFVVALAIGGGIYYWQSQQEVEEEPVVITPKPTTTAASPSPTTTVKKEAFVNFSTKYYKYKLVETGTWRNYDQKLIRINRETLKKETVVESVKEAVPELKKAPNALLDEFAQPDNSYKIFFHSILFDTDAPPGYLYVYNIRKNKFEKMVEVNKIYGGFGKYAISPDRKKFAWVPEGTDEIGKVQKMYLVSLINDSYKVIVRLTGNETFNGGYSALSSYYEIEWEDNDVIRFAVFNQAKKTTKNIDEANYMNSLIEYRTIDLLSPNPVPKRD